MDSSGLRDPSSTPPEPWGDSASDTPSAAPSFSALAEGLLAEELVRKAGHRLRVPKMMRSDPLPLSDPVAAAAAAEREAAEEIGGSIPLEFAVFALGLLAILGTVVGLYVAISRGLIVPPTLQHYDDYYARTGVDPAQLAKEL